MHRTSKPERIRAVLRIAGTITAVLLMVFLLAQQDWRAIGAALIQIPPLQLGVATAALIVSRLAISLRWHVLLSSGGARIKAGDSIELTFAGLFASNFLPSTIGGDVIRLAGAFRLEVDSALCLASLMADRLIGAFCMAFVLPFGLSAIHSSAAGMLTPTIALSMAVFEKKWVSWALEKGRNLARRLLDTVRLWLGQPTSLVKAMLFSFLHMLFFFASLSFLLEGLKSPMPYWLIAGLWGFIYLVTLLPISINGLGVQEVSIAYLFYSAGGISQQNSLLLALLLRTLLMITSLPGAIFLPSILATAKQHPEIIRSEQQ